MTRGLRFVESMVGTWHRTGETHERPVRFDVVAELPSLLRPLGTVSGPITGVFDATGLASAAPATGTITISPLQHRRIRYTLDFTGDDGRPYRFDGWKSIRWRSPLSTWTTLPGSITDRSRSVVGHGTLRFPLRDTASLVRSARVTRTATAAEPLEARRWDGRSGRMEVWYDTVTDGATGTGIWLHHELTAPSDGSDGYLHGWAAVFPSDGPPRWERFGPAVAGEGPWFDTGEVVAEPGVRRGSAGALSWDLRYRDAWSPLFTFPRWTWRRTVLPATQIVPSPTATWEGTVRVGHQQLELGHAQGGAARIYGHGNAERWGWLHADLGGGDVLEIVAAVSRHPVLNHFRPLPMVQIRVDGKVWPRNPLIAAPRLRARLDLPTWTVEGTWHGHRLRVEVTQPAEACVEVPYRDPDGATATCTNTERASARVVFDDREWYLDGTAHAEIGSRP